MSFLVAVAHQVLSKASGITCSKFINIACLAFEGYTGNGGGDGDEDEEEDTDMDRANIQQLKKCLQGAQAQGQAVGNLTATMIHE